MKKCFFYAAMAAVALCFASCGDNDNDELEPVPAPAPAPGGEGGEEEGGDDNVRHGDIEVVRIPAGTRQLGSPADEPSYYKDEMLHTVTISKDFANIISALPGTVPNGLPPRGMTSIP